ncbi:MAG: MFS transporter [Sneathiella sp.]|nr:MFS transporter [Sneathiella sp.]
MISIHDGNRKWWVLAAMGGTLALIVLDETVVGVALPTIRRELAMSQVNSHWIVNAYFLVFTVLAAAAGKMGDLFGYRNLFLAALGIFGLSSIACGFAESGPALITARAAQGLGAAVIFPFTVAMITSVFAPAERGRAFGIQTAIGGCFISMGPLVGGFLTDVLSWRWIFWINIPVVLIIAAVVIAAWREPAKKADGTRGRIDFKGLAALIIGLAALVGAVMEVPDYGWGNSYIIAGIIIGLVSLAVFIALELDIREPLFDLALFSMRTISVMNSVVFMGEFGKIALIVFGALFLQQVLGFSPLMAGAALLPAVVPSLFASLVVGNFADRFDARKISLIGLALNAGGMIWFAVFLNFESYVLLIPALIAWGCALPFHFVSTRRAIVNSVPSGKLGQSGGLTMTAQLLGGTVSMAVCGTILAGTGRFDGLYWLSGALMALVAANGFLRLRREEA